MTTRILALALALTGAGPALAADHSYVDAQREAAATRARAETRATGTTSNETPGSPKAERPRQCTSCCVRG